MGIHMLPPPTETHSRGAGGRGSGADPSHTHGPGKGDDILHPRAALGGWSKDPTRWAPSSHMLLFQTVAKQNLRLPGLARRSGPPLPRTVGQAYHPPQQVTISIW